MKDSNTKVITANRKSKGERMSLYKMAKSVKAFIRKTINLIHSGIVKSRTLIYSERGTADDLLAFPFITLIITLITVLLHYLDKFGIIHLPFTIFLEG